MSPYQIVRSKMEKTRVLLTDSELARCIPETVLYSPENLEKMLKKYSHVYVKPDCGRGGNRVIAIVMDDAPLCRIHYETKIQGGKTVAAAASFIAGVAAGDRFIIQQGIQLLCIKNVPFDLRVNVQKPYNRWEVTAMIAKKRPPGKAVTNFCQGGILVEIDQALLQAGINSDRTKKIISQLKTLGERTASVLNRRYRGLRELGLDVGLDRKARPWILEVNTKPQYIRGHKKFDHYRRIIRQNTRREYLKS